MSTIRLVTMLIVTLILWGCGNSDSTKPKQQKQNSTASVSQLSQETKPQSCRLVFGWDPWEPYQYQTPDKKVAGLDIELLTAVIKNAGCEVSYYRQGWAKLLKMLKDGQVDVLAGATKTASREKFAYFSDAYRNEEFYLYVEKDRLDKLKDSSFDQLMEEKFRIGVIQGYLYGDQVSKFQDDVRYQGLFVDASMSEINVSLLLDGEIDGFIEDKFVGSSIIRRKNLKNMIAEHPLRFENKGVHMMVSRSSVGEQLFKRLNKSLLELKDNGEIQKILDRYQL